LQSADKRLQIRRCSSATSQESYGMGYECSAGKGGLSWERLRVGARQGKGLRAVYLTRSIGKNE